jgi:hypothetical protein
MSGSTSGAASARAATIIPADAVRVRLDEPVLVDQAPPSLQIWGSYRIPKLSRLPDGDLCLSFQLGRDHYADQGDEAPFFRSSDHGRTWQRAQWPHPRFRGTGPVISRVHDGEYWCFPSTKGIEFQPEKLPPRLSTKIDAWAFSKYRLSDCSEDVVRWYHDLVALRWTPATKQWREEPVGWDHRGQLFFVLDTPSQGITGVWGQKTFIECPLVPMGKDLLHVDYWTIYEADDGSAPVGWDSWLMVSSDNGRTWKRRSRLTKPTKGRMDGEPVIERTLSGDLVGVVRVEDGGAHPMLLVRSRDQGHTWSPEERLLSYGVLPRLLQLENGVLVLSYGRAPGTWMSFSLDGGRTWTKPTALLVESQELTDSWKCSCGYTSLIALDRDSFLVTYGNRHLPNAKGEPCKSILTRRVEVKPG